MISCAHHSCSNSQAHRDGHCLFHPDRGETNPQQNLSEPERNSGCDSLGGQLGALQLHIPQGLQKFPTRAFFPQELHTSAQLQARVLPEHREGSPAQRGFAGLFPKPRGVLGST